MQLAYYGYRYLDPVSHIVYSFVVGITQRDIQELTRDQTNPNPGKIILEKLSDSEKKQLKEMLGIDVSPDIFRVLPVVPHPDHLSDLKSFNGEEGKKFRIYPKEIIKL